ncbi:MAG: efflux RND transporter periplasmic adaptor subunit [Prosthecobacter sp.]|jgi:cobalt-zinc-cadmium efflux system membrane fusion protein|uniref:efflux RND transporter periplasmic adaptor subunit n=1 Tax=Prosthecobacter sp. TaxID=1965333 RepID=UPI0019FB7076|nr:efflux RND transporter periplasmic adaptor subunit [Prosthecobacter sp.]MBE2284652.1 efflux RND transporter periplasmic adaptor subunit [Prosthecobacter sp.]
MKPFLFLLTPLLIAAAEPDRAANTVILDETSVKHLRLEFAEAEETSFEETVFALGHIEVLPGKKAIVSSRIPGRAFSVLVVPHQQVDVGAEVAWVESRQPGDPPPVIKLEAPINGMVSKVDIVQGQPVTPDSSLIEIVNLETVEAVASVPQHLAGRLAAGLQAHIRVNALPERVFEAKIAHIATVADETTGTIEAAFHVANPEALLRPGMRAEFSIVVSHRENVMSIPRSAVQGDASQHFVYIKDYELKHAFVKVPVVLGAQNDRFAEVLQGLLPGDEVVTRGAYSLGFAGKGSVSLKEAMDAAHGHPHNEDGTEMTKEQIAAAGHEGHEHDDHDAGRWNMLTTFFASTTGLLLVLLIVSMVLNRKAAAH